MDLGKPRFCRDRRFTGSILQTQEKCSRRLADKAGPTRNEFVDILVEAGLPSQSGMRETVFAKHDTPWFGKESRNKITPTAGWSALLYRSGRR